MPAAGEAIALRSLKILTKSGVSTQSHQIGRERSAMLAITHVAPVFLFKHRPRACFQSIKFYLVVM